MKKSLVRAFLVLVVFNFNGAFAAELPVVNCELMYGRTNPDGTTAESRRGKYNLVTTQVMKDRNGGFEMSANLEPRCAADGGPCDGYELNVSITKADSSNYLHYNINKLPWDRVSTALSVGNENGFVNCDIKQ